MGDTPKLDDVFRKYGETAEAAQLRETELGTLLLNEQCMEEGLFGADGIRATEIMRSINRDTLGGLIRKARSGQSTEGIEALLEAALEARNRLIHFYRKHNMRKFSDDGRMIMMQDLDNIQPLGDNCIWDYSLSRIQGFRGKSTEAPCAGIRRRESIIRNTATSRGL